MKNILVVDDDVEVTMIIEEILKQKNYRVLVAHDGLKAMERSNGERIDLILLDIRMPMLSGFWFCDAFKHKPQTKHIPIVMVSSLSDADEMRKAYKLGASDFLKKPFQSQELLEVVEKNLAA